VIPANNDDLRVDYDFSELPSRTYKLHAPPNTVSGLTDKRDAVRQAIYLILSVERYEHIIYSWNYGVELKDLFGKPTSYALPEIKRRVTEALTQDTRITGTDDFEFDVRGNVIHVTF
jgi:hypothetical protein